MGNNKIRLLLVEDDKVDQMAFERFVRDEKLAYTYTLAGSVAEAARLLAAKEFDIVIADYMLGDGNLFDLFDLLADIPVIVTTGAGNETVAVKAMKAGACDYLIKDTAGHYLSTLPFTVESAVGHKRAEKELENYREHLGLLVRERTDRLEKEMTAHRQTAAALQKTEEVYRAIFNQASDSILLIDPEGGTFLEYNEMAHRTLGYSREEFKLLRVKDIEASENKVEVKAHFKKLQDEKIDTFETTHKTKSGEIIDVFVSTKAFRLNDKYYILSIWRDIGERKRAEEELKIKAHHLEEVNIALNVLLKKREQDKRDLENSVAANINNLVVPSLEKLLHSGLSASQKIHAEITYASLKEVVSSFSRTISSRFLSLSPAEIQVANFIKHGKSSKEIAIALNVSTKTVKNQRQKIREKIGIKNKKVNLRTHLLSLE